MTNNQAAYKQHLKNTIEFFRLGVECQGSDSLSKFIDSFMPLIEVNADLLGQDEVNFLNELFAAQAREDYLFLADLLEYELPKTRLGELMQG